MPAFPFELIIPAFIAGIFTFLAPCTLPLVPGYLAYISGTSSGALSDPSTLRTAQRRILLNSVAFVLGFTLIFIFFGLAASRIGNVLLVYRTALVRIAGIFLILFGLQMSGVLRVPALMRDRIPTVPASFRRGNTLTSILFGAAFAVGWSPCIGPVLGTILTFAATNGSETIGAVLLGSFALGLATPFLVIALSISSATERITSYIAFTQKKKALILSVIGTLVGFLIATILFAIPFIRTSAIGTSLLLTLPFILPIVGAWALVRLGKHTSVDPITFGGGITITLLGILLGLNKLGFLISYAFMVLGNLGLGALERVLMRFL